MRLTFRLAERGDYSRTFIGSHSLARAGTIDASTLEAAWQQIRVHPSAISLVVDDRDRAVGDRCVGFAQAVFVTDQFAALVASGNEPYVNALLASSILDAVLKADEVREANSDAGLNVVVTHWNTRQAVLGEEDTHRVRDYLSRQFLTVYAGFRVRQIQMEVFGDVALQMAINAGFRLRSSYSGYFKTHNLPAPDLHPYLTGINHHEARNCDATLVSHAFIYSAPRFYLKTHEQELLCHALAGYSDELLADLLCVSLAAVRKRWASIYERVAAVEPELLPAADGGKRGAEKRRDLLAYLRDHPEELRPVLPLQSHQRCGSK